MYNPKSPRSHSADHGHSPRSPVSPAAGSPVRTNPHMMLSPGRNRRQGDGSSSRQGRHSPLTLPMEGMQSMNAGYGAPNYLGDGIGQNQSPITSPGSARSPYQSPSHSRSSSMTSVRSGLRDRSVERVDRERVRDRGSDRSGSGTGGPIIRDRSLDRQLDRHYEMEMILQRNQNGGTRERYPANGRERHGSGSHQGQDGDYLRAGSRSLDRDYSYTNYLSNQMNEDYAPTNHAPSSTQVRDTIVLDLQGQLNDCMRENAMYQKELEITKEKLSSSMNSIKTFWSPELKKERALRKEEASKITQLTEQLRLAQREQESHLSNIQDLEEQVQSMHGSKGGTPDMGTLQKEKDRQTKEIKI